MRLAPGLLSILAIFTAQAISRVRALAHASCSATDEARAGGLIASAWYAGWHARDFPLSKVSWSKYTQVTYAFAWVLCLWAASCDEICSPTSSVTTPDPHTLGLQDFDIALLPSFVTMAHNHVSTTCVDWDESLPQTQGVKAAVSIGGWAGSLHFSSNVATPANRTAFVKTVTDLAQTYDLDGIDFEQVRLSHLGLL
jgi:chitinase